MGIPSGEPLKLAQEAAGHASRQGASAPQLRQHLQAIVADPAVYCDDEIFGAFARRLMASFATRVRFEPRQAPAPYRQWGTNLEDQAVQQMHNACDLPISIRGALMPDAHVGYGLPIGGVLGTENAVIPYAVGVDIACRVRMSVYDISTQPQRGSLRRSSARPVSASARTSRAPGITMCSTSTGASAR